MAAPTRHRSFVRSYRNFYERIAPYYDHIAHAKDDYGAIAESLWRVLDRPKLVLELGIGTGLLAKELDQLGCRVVGVDVSRAMLSCATEKRLSREQRISLIQANATTLPFRAETFDAVVSFGGPLLVVSDRQGVSIDSYLLEDNVSALLTEIARVLHQGSFLAINVQNEPAHEVRWPVVSLGEYVLRKVKSGDSHYYLRQHLLIDKNGNTLLNENYRVHQMSVSEFYCIARTRFSCPKEVDPAFYPKRTLLLERY